MPPNVSIVYAAPIIDLPCSGIPGILLFANSTSSGIEGTLGESTKSPFTSTPFPPKKLIREQLKI